ncbi:MAG TPA: hypothetical protein VFF15_08540, partial [Flavobacteriaceae bacterium]|nr:hypothetical protein [Flavobacteriaceae bacterium]
SRDFSRPIGTEQSVLSAAEVKHLFFLQMFRDSNTIKFCVTSSLSRCPPKPHLIRQNPISRPISRPIGKQVSC